MDAARVTTCMIDGPLGTLVAGATDEGVCLLEFTEGKRLEAQVRLLGRHLGGERVPGDHPHLKALRAELSAYLAGELQRFTVPLRTAGTDFEQRVWRGLLQIPYGATRSSGDLARTLGAPGAARAVGRANGRNHIAIVIPCHRVVNHDGALGGYGGGLWRKRFLLDLENGAGRLPGA